MLHSVISQVLFSAAYCFVILTLLSCYSGPRRSYNTSSSAHVGFPGIRPSISAYVMRPFSHLGVYRLRPIITTYHPATPPPSGSYYVTLSPNRLLLLASCEIPAKVSQSCFSVASCRYQASLLHPPPCSSSSLHTFQILVVKPPTVPRLPDVSLYMSFPTVFPPLPALLLPQASPIYRIIFVALASP